MNDEDFSNSDEADIRKILQIAGQRESMPDELKKTWSRHFRKELDAASKTNKLSPLYWLAVCASLLMVTLLGLIDFNQPTARTDITVEELSGEVRETLVAGVVQALKKGQPLPIGSLIETKSQSFLAINYFNVDIRLNAETQLRIDSDELRLLKGEIFVSSSSQHTGSQIFIATPFATIRNIGTQFIVSLSNNQVATTVREGSIQVETKDTRTSATASANNAQKVTVNHQHHIDISEAPGTGERWEWIYHVAPAFNLEGKTVYEFLHWSTRESGLSLHFVNQRAELYARTTRLRGDIPKLNPDSSIPLVLATTDLTATITEQGLLDVQLNHP